MRGGATAEQNIKNLRLHSTKLTQLPLMEQKENLLDLLRVLLQWKKTILYTCVGIGLLTVLVSLLLPNYYQSTTIFYAASMDQAKPGHIFGTSTTDTDFYGNDHDNDRLMTIAESNELATYLINKFDLYTHYEIDTTDERASYKVKKKFFKYFNVTKTKRDAIELSMEDIDPLLAADIVNTGREKVDKLYTKVVQEQLVTLKNSLMKNIEGKEIRLQVISDSLLAIKSKFGIYDATSQGEFFAEQLLTTESKLSRESAKLSAFQKISSIPRDTISILKALVAGYKNELQLLRTKQVLFNRGLSSVSVFEREQKELANRLSFQKIQLNQLITANETPMSGINLIEAGAVPVMKSRPKRSIIVVSAVLISFLFSVIGILLFDAYQEVDWKALWRGE